MADRSCRAAPPRPSSLLQPRTLRKPRPFSLAESGTAQPRLLPHATSDARINSVFSLTPRPTPRAPCPAPRARCAVDGLRVPALVRAAARGVGPLLCDAAARR
eukprot:410740-Prymnesium_polylepis.1